MDGEAGTPDISHEGFASKVLPEQMQMSQQHIRR